MDEFGVLTERFGLKPQGKSAPMAASKQRPAPAPRNPNLNTSNGFPDDILFQSNPNNAFHDDVFGQFQNFSSNPSKDYDYDDVFGLNTRNDDVFGSFASPPTQTGGLDDDLLGGFVGSKISNQNANASDDLIPGFAPVNGTNVEATYSTFVSEDPFIVLERTSTLGNSSSDPFVDPLEELGKITQSGGLKPNVSKASSILKPPSRPAQVLKAERTSIDALEEFAMGKVRNSSDGHSGLHHTEGRNSVKASKYKAAEDAAQKTQKKAGDDLEDFFSSGSRSNSVPRSRASTTDPIFDTKVNSRGADVAQKKSSGGSSTVRKVSSANNLVDDLSSIFGAAPSFGEFEEFEGEPEERRRARLGRQMRTNDRIVRAL